MAIAVAVCADWLHGSAVLCSDLPHCLLPAALQASCTDTVKESIMQVLRLKDPIVIKSSLNRHNIE